jgi:hypothetical protein
MSRSELGPVEHSEQLGLIGVQPLQQAIERDEASAATEDAIEPRTHLAALPSGRRRTVGFQIGVEPPNQCAERCRSVKVSSL